MLDNLKNISLVVSFYILLLETFVVVLLFGAYKFSVYLRKSCFHMPLCGVSCLVCIYSVSRVVKIIIIATHMSYSNNAICIISP